MKFSDFTWQEIEEFSKKKVLIILPLGCTEQQGPHLAVGWDNKFITELCIQASEEAQKKGNVESLVLPTIPVGPTPEHMHWPGYLNISKETHEQIILEILESLKKQGFNKIIIWSGCGGHDLQNFIDKYNRKHPDMHIYYPQVDLYGITIQVGGRKFVEDAGHADAPSTSWCLYLDPTLVRKEKIKNSNSSPVDWSRLVKDFNLYTEEGALGNITLANREVGEKSWKLIIKEAADIIRKISEGKV